MKAILFDIYNTLLEVGPAPDDASERWEQLFRRFLDGPAPLTLAQFRDAYRAIVAREHAAARNVGIAYPEIFWPAVASEAIPALRELPASGLDDFLFGHARIVRSTRLMPGAAEILARLSRQPRTVLGIVSNAQPYTLREFDAALATARLSRSVFTVCFWSFEHGFSKPDPHVFRMIAARLNTLGIPPAETAMIGDRLDNDIEPARQQGWRTWHISGSLADPPDWLWL